MTITINLGNGFTTIVDDEDSDLADLKWYIGGKITNPYAVRGRAKTRVYLHRIILEQKLGQSIPPRMQGDHIDRNPLNNVRANLRLATISQNTVNSRVTVTRPKSSQFKGVHWEIADKCWRAEICANGCKYQLGRFRTEIDAAHAYDEAAKRLHGEFATLNIP